MPLSLNEIKDRAVAFSREWKDEISEDAEAKSFWDGFFNVFGISRRRTATFETKVHKLGNKDGFIDLLWKGVILVEHKSRGKDLDRAYQQAKDYFPGLKEKELPRYILVCDFWHFKLYDLEQGTDNQFTLDRLIDNIHLFGFISGYQKRTYKDQDPVNIEAAGLMGRLHDQLKAVGYTGHELEVYLVRLLFCLFADDTNIFERGIFEELIDMRTAPDGSDLAMYLDSLFMVLNSPKEKRLKNLDEQLAAFPYVNGKLFDERLPHAAFDTKMRQILLECCYLDWSKISPAIFGSLFQSVMDEKARRNLGAHYTSEKNILKVIKPLFLDELSSEFEKVKSDIRALDRFHHKLSELRFLDPACGCGNFLIIAYRELRLLEIEVLKAKFKNQIATNIDHYINVNVDQFYGIEYEEFPAQIAQVAMWLIDHQINQIISMAFGEYFVRLPLRKSAKILHANALRTNWQSLIEPTQSGKEPPIYNYILGNPPFIGSKLMTDIQREDLKDVFLGIDGVGILDYVTAWYCKAAEYLQKNNTQIAFVSTNSIAQGEQVSVLWDILLNHYKVKINFAHQTFKWSNEAKGVAAVYCVIIGFSGNSTNNKRLFQYSDIKGEPHELRVSNINPYLVEGKDVIVNKKQNPICNVPKMSFGNMPLDGGNLLFSDAEKNEFLSIEPKAEKFIKPLISAYEYLNGEKRWCLWLVDAEPNELKSMPEVLKRIDLVRKFRLKSLAPSTQKFASTPSLFRDRNNPKSFIVIPRVSSENRRYIPIGFFDNNYIVSDTCMSIPNGTLYHFGVLTSLMHMSWVSYTCGRLESRFRYSKDIVYNNYPWPENPSEKNIKAVEVAASQVLDVRSLFPTSSLADLYDPNTMPPELVKAHQVLDKAVDLCYRPKPFAIETKRIEYLFELYDKYTAGLFAETQKKKPKKKTD